ncbi:MAG: hypothetical protein MI861_14800 [Pirellulales bacterium]|nr:hypothetical protein [Pirellulales bacterium]
METAIVCRFALAALSLLILVTTFEPARAQESSESEAEKYLLRYDLKVGEKLHYEVTHVAKTRTSLAGSEEVSQVHTVSQRHWDVTHADDENFTFNHVLDAVEMMQQQGDEEEVRWDSREEGDPPVAFERVAEQIGDVISTLTVNHRGQETGRDKNRGTEAELGMGTLTLALPDEPIAVGQSWSVPREVRTRKENGEVKRIKIRELYTLTKVKTGVATISIRSQPLTPIYDQSIRGQVVQQLSNGEIRFDIDAGRMLSKQLSWDEEVIGFRGHNSAMEYRARLTERLVDGVTRTAQRP